MPTLPPIEELLDAARVVVLPLTTRFRGVGEREVLLLEGPHGWSEFSPFTEYGDAEAATWLRAAIDFGWSEAPPTLRSEVGVNATLPAVGADRVAEVLERFRSEEHTTELQSREKSECRLQ